jgi:hypothetical protein
LHLRCALHCSITQACKHAQPHNWFHKHAARHCVEEQLTDIHRSDGVCLTSKSLNKYRNKCMSKIAINFKDNKAEEYKYWTNALKYIHIIQKKTGSSSKWFSVWSLPYSEIIKILPGMEQIGFTGVKNRTWKYQYCWSMASVQVKSSNKNSSCPVYMIWWSQQYRT